jgi:lipopolysaccharide export system permease protein
MSLSFFFIVIDLLANYSKLPDSSNLQVLYIYYVALYSFDVFYPLALVFAFLLTVYYMIKFNEIVSFYSLCFSPGKILKPFILLALIVTSVFFTLDSGKFAYVREYADSILNKKQFNGSNLFLKYQNKIIYIKKIKPILKEADNLKVFILKNGKITEVISAQKAKFKNDVWYVQNAEVTEIKNDRTVKKIKNLKILKGFKPKIISNLKNLSSISFYDAYIAVKLFDNVNVNTLLSIVFYKIFTAFSLVSLIAVFIFKMPVHQRISNVSLFLVKSTFLTIMLWGVQLVIYKFSKQGVLPPYVLVLPFVVVAGYVIYLLYKEK